MSVAIQSHNPGYLYRCKITDADGNVVYSEPGEIRDDTLAIVTQPEDFLGVVGDTVRFTVEAYGEGLTYRWQSSVNGGSSWNNFTAAGYSTPSMSVLLEAHNPGYLYRCKVTDADGNVIYSEPAEIKVAQIHWDFTYDANGMRTSRTNGSTTYNYVYNGGSLSQMTVGSNTLNFAYDASGTPMAVTYNGTNYYYVTNLQGDVVAILNSSGSTVVSYTYDAWGNILETDGSMKNTLGVHNPLRYRGYVYDQETELYYLQSRYYDPEVGRFINADALVSTGQGLLGNNMFAYCLNNPANSSDPQGLWTLSISFGYDITLFFFGVSRTINFVIDDNWNFAIQTTNSAPTYASNGETSHFGMVDVGAGVSVQVTDDDTVYDLEGSACNAGFSVGDGPYLGADVVYSGAEMFNEDDADRLPNGISVTFGFGAGMDVHFKQTQTNTIFAINILEGH